MKVTCPVCYASHELASIAPDGDAAEFIALLIELPAIVQAPALRYLQLFRARGRELAWGRSTRILELIAPMIIAGTVTRERVTVDASPDAWASAMRELSARTWDKLPLKSHGYLLEVVMSTANKLRGARADAGVAEAAKSARGRHSDGPVGVGQAIQTGTRGGSPAVVDTPISRAEDEIRWAKATGRIAPKDDAELRELITTRGNAGIAALVNAGMAERAAELAGITVNQAEDIAAEACNE